MSRTYKDKPSRILHENYWQDRSDTYPWIYFPTTKTKKRKEVDTEWHWIQATPGWWVRTFMTKPQRRAGSLWERLAVTTEIEELDGIDTPSVSRKPHIYYW